MSRTAVRMSLLRGAMLIWVAPLFLIFFIPIPYAREIGYSLHSTERGTVVSAGSHPVQLVWSSVTLIFFLALMQINVCEIRAGVPTLARRFFAFLTDFLLRVITVAPFAGLVPLWMEAMRTGHFEWHFQRDYSVPGDELMLVGVPVTMALMLLYFVWPLMKGKQTVGCFIFGIKVTPPFGDSGVFTFRAALRRVWYEFKGLASLLRIRERRD